MTPLGESFSAVNTRFHLAGISALAALLVRFAQHWTGDDPAGLPLMIASLVLFIAANSGIFGTLFQAAMTPRPPLSFLRWSGALFIPVFWLLFKVGLLQVWLIALVAVTHQALSGQPLSESLQSVTYWGRPLFDLVARLLILYSLPICILSRVRREARPAIRQGIRFYRACPSESGRLVLLLLAITALEGSLNYALGRGVDKDPPGVAEGLVALLGAYLSLVAFFGATRIVLARLAAGSRESVPGADPASPGRRP